MDLSAINFNELKSACKSLNDSGLMKKKIKLVGLKKAKMVEQFVAAVDKLDDEGLTDDLPDAAFDFYNSLSDADEETEEEEIEDDEVEDDEEEEDEDDEEEEDEEDEDEDEDEEDEEEDEEEEEEVDLTGLSIKELRGFINENELDVPEKITKKTKAKIIKKIEKQMAAKKKPAKAKGKGKAKAKGKGKAKKETTRKRVATKKMSCKIEESAKKGHNGYCVIQFEDDDKPKKFLMPKKGKKDKARLKVVIKNAVDYAREGGATEGQIKAVRKAFTKAGWYMTK